MACAYKTGKDSSAPLKHNPTGGPGSQESNSEAMGSQLGARLDALVGEFVSLRIAMLQPENRAGSCDESLATLFSDSTLTGTETTVKACNDIVLGVQIGVEPTTKVLLSVRPKQDFSRSPTDA